MTFFYPIILLLLWFLSNIGSPWKLFYQGNVISIPLKGILLPSYAFIIRVNPLYYYLCCSYHGKASTSINRHGQIEKPKKNCVSSPLFQADGFGIVSLYFSSCFIEGNFRAASMGSATLRKTESGQRPFYQTQSLNTQNDNQDKNGLIHMLGMSNSSKTNRNSIYHKTEGKKISSAFNVIFQHSIGVYMGLIQKGDTDTGTA